MDFKVGDMVVMSLNKPSFEYGPIGIIEQLFIFNENGLDSHARVKFPLSTDYYYLRYLRKVVLIGPN